MPVSPQTSNLLEKKKRTAIAAFLLVLLLAVLPFLFSGNTSSSNRLQIASAASSDVAGLNGNDNVITNIENLMPQVALHALPNTVAIGDALSLILDVSPLPPTRNDCFSNLTLVVYRPDGTVDLLGPLESDSNGSLTVTYKPEMVGNYTTHATYAGQTFTSGNITYLGAKSSSVSFSAEPDEVAVWGENESSTFYGWQIENYGGSYSEANSTLRLSTPGGTNCPSITLYRQISPTADFSLSSQIKGLTMESCAIIVRSELPMKGAQGFNLEFGHYGDGMFILSRYTEKYNWTWNTFAFGESNTWYTVRLDVVQDPFKVEAKVFDGNNQLLGSFSAGDMSNLLFEDIKYIGLIVWGYSPSDYLFRNIISDS